MATPASSGTCLNGVRPQEPESAVTAESGGSCSSKPQWGPTTRAGIRCESLSEAPEPSRRASMGSGHEGRNQSTNHMKYRCRLRTPQWGPATRAGISERQPVIDGEQVASMGSGHEGRNQPGGAFLSGEVRPASMGSGHEGRNQSRMPTLPADSAYRRLNGVRPRGPESDGRDAEIRASADRTSMGSGHEGRNQVAGDRGRRRWVGGLNGVRPRGPESVHEPHEVPVPVADASMGSGHEGRNQGNELGMEPDEVLRLPQWGPATRAGISGRTACRDSRHP